MRDARIYLDDILHSITRIESYVGEMTSEDFETDEKTQDAVIRNLEIIGEAVGKLPDTILQSHPEIEWHKIKALRNILVHEYFGINIEIVWDVVQNKLRQLKSASADILKELDSQG
ncbi:MAG: DUF86 domain-containing protein [Bacteroidota bacterium]|nr:DUF86 domain-containing protein [Bacteroidota bacterium]